MAETKSKSLLVVDDDEDILLTAKILLKPYFQKVYTENKPHEILKLIEGKVFDAVLLDMNFTVGFTSGKEGLRWLKKIRKEAPTIPVVLMTAYGDVRLAVRAMKEGATDFVLKPWDNEALIQALTGVFSGRKENVTLKTPVSVKTPNSSLSNTIIGESTKMMEVFSLIEKVGPTDANVLILGENGTGKELIAKALHAQSRRSTAPFIQVDLGAISETLFESELFGHVKGAFTDAREDRAGRFEVAHTGTLFLDEVGNLPFHLQAKLLTALQSRQVTRVGSYKTKEVDIRLLCATNMPLYEMVHQSEFRQDLLYRINTVEVTLPPLRERGEDIPLLVDHFLSRYTQKYQAMPLKVSKSHFERMRSYDWPGNIRELQHVVERAVIMGDPEILIPASRSKPVSASPVQQNESVNLEEVEKEAIKRAIEKFQGNISKAAKELGLGRTTLYRKIEKYGL
ncbi:MAG: sigma-54 dependent transcriptional regulator [Bacteroidota bacterium]